MVVMWYRSQLRIEFSVIIVEQRNQMKHKYKEATLEKKKQIIKEN